AVPASQGLGMTKIPGRSCSVRNARAFSSCVRMLDLLIYHSAVIRSPHDAPPARKGLSRRALIWASAALVLLAWVPVLALHLRNMSVADPGTGTLLAVFAPTSSRRDVFRGIADSKGVPVAPVSWAPGTWIVQSTETGFAGRLREQGAW